MLPNSMEDAALNSHLAWQDRAEAMEEMTYHELLEARDEASENSSWVLMNELRGEIESRQSDAGDDLKRIFKDAINGKRSWIPTIVGSAIAETDIAEWVRDTLDTGDYQVMLGELLLGTRDRESVVNAMADEYVELVCEDVLQKGWMPE